MPTNCSNPDCGKPMIVMHWNSTTDVLVCDNSGCRLFRQPTPIPKGSTTLAEELSKVYVRRKRHPWREIHATATLEERLQELRDEVSA